MHLATLICGNFEGTLRSLISRAIVIIEEWCEENTLSVNPTKTHLVLFNKRRNNSYVENVGNVTLFVILT